MTKERNEYPVFCPWCRYEGRSTRTGVSKIPYTSGICRRHIGEVFSIHVITGNDPAVEDSGSERQTNHSSEERPCTEKTSKLF